MGIHNIENLQPEATELDITPVPLAMSYQQKAMSLVFEYVKARIEKTDDTPFNEYDVYVVWFAKTLQNWKCLISTELPDGMYYEVTHNGTKAETYVDAYKKFDNFCITDEDFDEGMRVGGRRMFQSYVTPGSLHSS